MPSLKLCSAAICSVTHLQFNNDVITDEHYLRGSTWSWYTLYVQLIGACHQPFTEKPSVKTPAFIQGSLIKLRVHVSRLMLLSQDAKRAQMARLKMGVTRFLSFTLVSIKKLSCIVDEIETAWFIFSSEVMN